MNIRDLASLAFTVVGLLALLATTDLVQALVTMPFYQPETSGNRVVLTVACSLPLLIVGALGLLFILRRNQLAAAFFPDTTPRVGQVTLPDVQDLAYSVLGALLTVTTLPDLGALAGQLINLRAMESTEHLAGAFGLSLPHYVGTLLKLVIGAYLFFYGNKVGEVLRGLRRTRSVAPQPARPLPRCPSCGKPYDPVDYRSEAAERLCSDCKQPLPPSVSESA